jgi:hypothetical protein
MKGRSAFKSSHFMTSCPFSRIAAELMATFNEQLLKIVEDYRASGGPWPATKVQMAEWAVANDRYQLTRGMAVSQCAEKIARAMQHNIYGRYAPSYLLRAPSPSTREPPTLHG